MKKFIYRSKINDIMYFSEKPLAFTKGDSATIFPGTNTIRANPKDWVILFSMLTQINGTEYLATKEMIEDGVAVVTIDGERYICDGQNVLQVEDICEEVDEWIPAAEAARQWNLGDSTIRVAIHRRYFFPDEYKKMGRDWFVKISAMERLYGELTAGSGKSRHKIKNRGKNETFERLAREHNIEL